MSPKLAAVTMAYNEAAFLPVWARHYARQVGADHCYVVDHGSTELPALPSGINVLRLPRSPQDDGRRAGFISELTKSLLSYFDWVLYSDVDELVLADPRRHANLQAFCETAQPGTLSAVGLDVQHLPDIEPPFDPALPVGAQRGWVRFTSSMCKPVLTRVPVNYAPGFHCSDQPLAFGQLYLFHLHWADRDLGLRRLAKTRSMPWADDRFGAHQRISDREWGTIFDGMAQLPRRALADFDPAHAPIQPWLQHTINSAAGRQDSTHSFDLHVNAPELWPIPSHFRARL